MATSLTENTVGDITLCSICFEKFKTPRYLPCSHSFCHGCLSSYIVSLCTSTEPRFGFNCPLCREYTPSNGVIEKPEEWAGSFPVNDVLEKIVLKSDERLCDSCLRDNESENATGFCLSCTEYLCIMCTKYHKRHLLSRDHTICSMDEVKSRNILPEFEKNIRCPEHNKKIKLFCNDHEEPCCLMCIGTKHKKCENVDSIEVSAASIRENGKLDTMLDEARDIEKKLMEGKNAHDKNTKELEDFADKVTERNEKEFKDIVDHIEKMKNKYLEDVAVAVKKGKENINKTTNSITDGIQCAKYYCEIIEKTRDMKDNAAMIVNYFKTKQNISKMRHFHFTKKNIEIFEKNASVLKQILDVTSLGDVEYHESEHSLFLFNVRTMKLSFLSEVRIAGDVVHCGTFLSDGNFAIADFRTDGKCSIYGKTWDHLKDIGGLSNPFGVIQNKDELFVTCTETRSIEVFSALNFDKVRSIPMNESVYGISSLNGEFYIACVTKIIKTDVDGKKIKEYEAEGQNNICVVVTKDGLIIYSNWKLHLVTAITDQGDIAWTYENPNMREPRGLEKDSYGNILVAARSSNNIHVLSSAGELLKTFEGIPKPVFMKISEERNVCCVCSDYKIVKVYKMSGS
ncbi:probable E3 ubiquitin-protein ligase MID2 [Saccostrea cucullata]|uniref:probable E3 ubiquitin-protein ligase MID2 n=1 Tax=Saccostrea cuccullata TaxID=36930 RepID=UPI002ED011E0